MTLKNLFLIAIAAAISMFAVACSSDPEIQIKEVEVVREVIKEVPVEKEVIKEVITEKIVTQEKEVPVEKIVTKEVQVIKEVPVQVEKIITVKEEVIVVATPEPIRVGEGGQKYGGTLLVGTVDFGTMDPALMGLSTGSAHWYANHTYDNLTEPWYDGSIVNRVVTEWSASGDLSTYTMAIRPGIKFHSGNDLTSADVKYSFDRILDPATASPLLEEISYIDSIDTPDSSTVVFNLGGPNINLPKHVSDYHARIVPNGATNEQLTTEEHGSGPYTLGDHNPAERTVMDKFPTYWREGQPFIDRIILYYMPEQTTRIEAIKSGAIDIVAGPNFSVIPDLAANSNISLAQVSTASIRNLVMDNREGSVFADKNVRKALQYAVDRDFIRQAVLFEWGENANDHPIGKNDPMFWKDQPIINQDLTKASEYLAAAGYSDSNPLDLTLNAADFSQMLDASLAVQASIAATGLPINIEVQQHESSTYWESVWMNEGYDLVVSAWSGRPASEAVTVALKGGGVWNETYFNSPRMDELLDAAASEGDFEARKAMWQEIQEILIEEVPAIYLMYTPAFIAHRTRVEGVKAHPRDWFFIEDWSIND